MPPDQFDQPASEKRLHRLFPFLGFWQGRSTLTADIIAGITVGLVLVPQAMAYAALAGMPPATGLYAASFACIMGALFGRCAQLNTGPVAMTSLLTFAAVAPLAAGQGEEVYFALAAVLAILVGVIRIIVGLCRGTALVSLVSQPVLAGFTAAAGITIASTQIPQFFNMEQEYANPVFNVAHAIVHIADAHMPSLALGFGTLLVMILLKKFAPRLPGLLIGLIGAGLVSWLIDFEQMGGRIVGNLPAGLPQWALPEFEWHMVPNLLGGAVLVVVIGLLEVMTVTTAAERSSGKRTDLNGEMIGQGIASLTAGVTHGFPVSGSLSRSSLNTMAGARTGFSSVVSGFIVIFTLIFLTPLLRPLPYPALAAAIVMAVSALIRPRDLINAFRVRRLDGIAGLLTFTVTIIAAPDMTLGIACGVGFSVSWILVSIMRPRCEVLQCVDEHWVRCENPTQHKKSCVIRIDGRAVFLNVQHLRSFFAQVLNSMDNDGTLILYAAGINHLDASGAASIAELAEYLKGNGGELIISGAKIDLRQVVANHPVLAKLRQTPDIDCALQDLDHASSEADAQNDA